MRGTWAVIVATAALWLAACGEEAPAVPDNELSAQLERVRDRLERAGFEVEARSVGPFGVTALVVVPDDGHAPVLVLGREAKPSDLPGAVRGVAGGTIRTNFSIVCGGLEIRGASGADAGYVNRAAGVCRGPGG